ncbi:VOC family protein [Virgibacillus oceani]|uniref:Ornithine monooxygenase n=1 Tax=Virgibacillus oceani TaxID=1479511 RepID=A0A917HMR3_9BACI|nr:VOC family protein [Virgibacillus oceani]GGG83714.1 hypothetical protein GCM10011398_31610 [Virgibacillus oceani]
MIHEMTVQVRVTNINEGQKWYQTFFNRQPDFKPHEGFAEWEIIPNCWLQLAEGEPAEGSGPIRLGVVDIVAERNRLENELHIEHFEIFSRKEVPVKWATFGDPWGNRLGIFEYVDEDEKDERIKRIIKTKD